ncbi:ankyrin repeat domain-containing protein [Chitinophaga barathri]|uniref:Ankyrin repeat domain-containing protein n=1 Tax=Chitinophaga barathri TaxID=1647451 RepID=A0A3N4MT80_9BACT|nr:ankyrin repeat domain-containing protein [Chitinophaga barathri]RPD38623.1 ankyrin repeat domain-containing protein [Chitinophaga barathri]
MKQLLIILMLGVTPACAQQKKDLTMKETNADKKLLAAATANDTTAVQRALAAGADKETRDNEGRTPLMAAVYRNHTAVARLLIEAGANVNAQDKILNSPFLYAGAEGFTAIVQMCMKAGADYTVYNRYGGSALIPACEHGHVETVAALLSDPKFPVDHINRLGWTGLLEAIILGTGSERHIAVVKMLIAAGANVNIADKDGVTPLTHARHKGQKEIIRLLEEAGAK